MGAWPVRRDFIPITAFPCPSLNQLGTLVVVMIVKIVKVWHFMVGTDICVWAWAVIQKWLCLARRALGLIPSAKKVNRSSIKCKPVC